MKKVGFVLFWMCNFLAIKGQGLLVDSASYHKLPKWEASEQGFTNTSLPSSVSYKKFTPFVGNQGQVSTCVGWAVAHGHLTTQQNLEMGITNSYQRSWRAMDPHFVYAFIRDRTDQWCEKGTSMVDAMNVLSTFGCKPRFWEPILFCNSIEVGDELVLAEASSYKIGKWYALRMDEPIVSVKQALVSKYIVSVGMMLTESFQNGSTVKSGKWSPQYGERIIGAHAMCVIGYDDYKYGGAFQILNSYGTNFGEEGYLWVTYADFAKAIGQAFIFDTRGFRNSNCLYGDCRNSISVYKSSEGGLYEGVVENGYPAHLGQYIYPDGSMYVGGWNQGRKNGRGLLYSVSTQSYFNVTFNNDILVRSQEIQGFSGLKEENKFTAIFKTMFEIMPGTLKNEDSQEYKSFAKEYIAPIEPIQMK